VDTRNPKIDRRGFMKTGASLAAGAAMLKGATARAAVPDSKSIQNTGAIPVRRFGKTGHELPVFGHGGSAMINIFFDKYQTGDTLGSVEERVAMVRQAYDMGVRYFDTARGYAESESIMGKALNDVRDNVYIASKVAVFDPAHTRRSVEKSLEELQTDYVDSMQIHSPSIERLGVKESMKIHAELDKMRDEGMIRFLGLTTHVAFEEVYEMISTGGFDQVLLARGYFNMGLNAILTDPTIQWREACMAKAHELDMGIVVMKVLGAAIFAHNARNLFPDADDKTLGKLPAAAIRYVMSDPRVSMCNLGISFPSDLEKNLTTFTGDMSFTNQDRELLAKYSVKAYESEMVQGLEKV